MRRFKHILCVLNNGGGGRLALERAITLAENNHAKLTVTIVTPTLTAGVKMPQGGPVTTELQKAIVSEKQQDLENRVKPFSKRVAIQTKVLIGISFLEIIREVLRQDNDLVIKIPEAADWLNRLFGSDDMHLLRKCPCPVWLIKPEAVKSYRRILAAIDVSDEYPPAELSVKHALNRQTLDLAISLALSEFAELHIVYAWQAVGESAMRGVFMHTSEEKVNAHVKEMQQHHANLLNVFVKEVTDNIGRDALEYLKPEKHLIKGLAHKEIPALAKAIDADLVVMGTVARTGVPGIIMGNTAETILNQIDCSVLAIKPPGFQTPITVG